MSRKFNILNNILTILLTVGSVFLCVLLCNARYSLNIKDVILFYVIGLVVAVLLISFTHELGHLIFGLKNGFAMISFKVLFFRFYKEKGKVLFSFCGMLNAVGATEMVSKSQENIEKRFKKMSAGGLILSLIPLIIGIVPLFISSIPYQLFAVLSVFLPVSLYSIVGNGFPSSEYGARNDGAVLLGIKKNDDHTKVLYNLLKIQSCLYNGQTPCEIDEKLFFDLPQLPEDDLNFIYLLNYRYMYYLDKQDYEMATKTMQRLLSLTEYMDKQVERQIKTDALFEYCTFNFDADKADELMYELESYLNKNNSVSNVRAKLAYISKVTLEAEQVNVFYKKALREAKKCPLSGIAKYETKLIESLKPKENV